jgi:hypothetical protein
MRVQNSFEERLDGVYANDQMWRFISEKRFVCDEELKRRSGKTCTRDDHNNRNALNTRVRHSG